MRTVREFTQADCKVTIFSWNNRYLIKLEQGLLEQTFKVAEMDVAGEEEVVTLIDAEFIQQAAARFAEMGQSLHEAMRRSGL